MSLDQILKVRRSRLLHTLEHQDERLEFDPLVHWEPVKLSQDWCDVVTFAFASDQTSRRILDPLQDFLEGDAN